MQLCTQWTHSDVWSQLATMPECLFKIGDRQSEKKWRLEGDMQRDAWYWRRARSKPPPGCLWRLWRSVSTLTEPFRPDGNVFCWCSFSFWHTSLHNRPPSASSPCDLKGKVTLSHSHGCEVTNWWIESLHLAHRPFTASKYLSNLAPSWPSSASPNSLDEGIQVSTITTSKCIFKLAPLRLPSASLSTLDPGLHVHFQTRSIIASKSIFKLARSRPPSSQDHDLPVHLTPRSISASKFAWSWPPSASRNLLDHSLQVNPQIRLISISECISKFTRSGPPSVSPYTLDYPGPPRVSPTTLNYCLESASPKTLDHGLGVYLWVHSIVICRHSPNFSQAPPSASPDIPCVDG